MGLRLWGVDVNVVLREVQGLGGMILGGSSDPVAFILVLITPLITHLAVPLGAPPSVSMAITRASPTRERYDF